MHVQNSHPGTLPFPAREDMYPAILQLLRGGQRSSRQIEDELAAQFRITPKMRLAKLRSGCPVWRNHVSWALVELGKHKGGGRGGTGENRTHRNQARTGRRVYGHLPIDPFWTLGGVRFRPMMDKCTKGCIREPREQGLGDHPAAWLLVVLAALASGACGAEDKPQPPITLDGKAVAVTYGRYRTEEVRDFLEPVIRSKGYNCGSLVNALEVQVKGRQEPPAVTYIQAYCAGGQVYQVAIFEPERSTVVRPWSHQLIANR